MCTVTLLHYQLILGQFCGVNSLLHFSSENPVILSSRPKQRHLFKTTITGISLGGTEVTVAAFNVGRGVTLLGRASET